MGRGAVVRGMRGRDGSALQPLGRPTPVEVRTDGSGRPLAFRRRKIRGRRTAGSWKRVVQIRESWRIDDEWWRRPISRLYQQVVLEEGRAVTLYRDLVEGGWYVQ